MSGGDDNRAWRIRLSAAARMDIEEIIRWTRDRHGPSQANAYGAAIYAALEELGAGPDALGGRPRPDLRPGLSTYHIARGRRSGRHLFVFRVVDRANRHIQIVRVLHDAMDIVRHIPTDDSEE